MEDYLNFLTIRKEDLHRLIKRIMLLLLLMILSVVSVLSESSDYELARKYAIEGSKVYYDPALVIESTDREAKAEVFLNQSLVTPDPLVTGKSYTESGSGVDFDMVYIEGGTFQMGSNNGAGDEIPVHSVTVSSFYMGKYEVTNREYLKYDSTHQGKWSNASYPVESVSWEDAVGYCRWLSGRTGQNYRLPTEAEWEYACRAGSTTAYYWGDSMNDSYCWYGSNSSNHVQSPGKKLPNMFGLFDMSGNVWEWCNDWYDENYYSQSPSNNPAGPDSGTRRVSRGGGWCYSADDCRSAYRDSRMPGGCFSPLGFRLCRIPFECY